MDDILSQGGDREPSRWPRRLGAVAVAVAVVVAGVVYISLPHHPRPAAVARPSATTRPTPAPVVTAAPVPTVAALPGEPNGIIGRSLPWETSLRLPLTGKQPAWFSPASGRSQPIAGLPDVGSGYQFTRVTGGWAVLARPVPPAGCGACAGSPVTAWFLADGTGSVTRVGRANLAAASATAGAVWLTSYPSGARPSSTAGTAREVSLATGKLLGPPVRLPPGYVIDQATNRGLLLAPASQPLGTPVDKLWDPASRHFSRTFASVIAASPTEIAWTSGCVPTCQIRLLHLATGRQTVVRLPQASSAAGGAFSPDGNFLALQVSFASTGDEGSLATQLEAASVATGRLTVMPGTWVSSDALIGYGWPASGDRLVAAFSFMIKAQLASWQPGASRPAVTVIPAGRAPDSLILG